MLEGIYQGVDRARKHEETILGNPLRKSSFG